MESAVTIWNNFLGHFFFSFFFSSVCEKFVQNCILLMIWGPKPWIFLQWSHTSTMKIRRQMPLFYIKLMSFRSWYSTVINITISFLYSFLFLFFSYSFCFVVFCFVYVLFCFSLLLGSRGKKLRCTLHPPPYSVIFAKAKEKKRMSADVIARLYWPLVKWII